MNPTPAQTFFSNVKPDAQDTIIGELLGAKPLSQYYLKAAGEHHSTPFSGDEQDDAAALLAFVKGRGWQQFKEDNRCLDSDRETMSLELKQWHVRYAQTAAGGWMVIEALRTRGFDIQISSYKGGWKLSALGSGNAAHTERHERIEIAACLMALRCIQPASVH